MAIRSGFFMSVDGDRVYKSDFFAEYFATFIGNGVFPKPSDNLQVIANNDMTITVGKGSGWINGYVIFNDSNYLLNLEPADGVLNRIDRVVLRWDSLDREIKILVKKGEFASSPVARGLQRDADAYELALADVYVGKGVVSVTQSDVTDLRLNDELCGIVHGVVEQVDATAIFNQFESWYSQTKVDYDADVANWTKEKQDEFILWYQTTTAQFEQQFIDWYTTNTTQWDTDFTTWFNDIKGRLVGDIATNLAGQIQELEKNKASKVDLTNHINSSVLDSEVHDIRVKDKSFQYFNGVEWITVNEGFKVGNTSNFTVERQAGLKIEVSFGDPEDSVVIDESGERVTLAEWGGTQLRAKLNSYPVDENDGELLEDIKVRDKYKSTPFVHSGLTNGDKWHYMAFPYTKNNVFTVDASNRGQATATSKLDQAAPSAPVVSELEFDKAKVTGGDSVSLDKTTWFDSPHLFTGLTEETAYTAYAKYKETVDYLESPLSAGKSFTTPSDMPGPSNLVGGDMQAGYFGIVPAAELYTGDELATAVGITQGTSQFSNEGWLKFAIDGKIIYKSKKPFRHSISWDHIDSKGCVDGTKTVTKDGVTYEVTLMKGANKDPAGGDQGAMNHGSEWNKLMLPIHERAKDQSWKHKNNVDTPTEDWDVGFTDEDLHTHNNHGDGAYQWCQEEAEGASRRVNRGGAGVSDSHSIPSSNANAFRGWSPVLRVIE